MTVGVYKLGELKYVKYCSTIWCWYFQNFDELLMKTLCYSLYSIQYILKARWVLFHVGRQWWWAAKLLLQCFSCWPVLLGPKKLPPLLPEWKEAESINARRRNHNFMVQYGDPGWKGIKWYGHLEQKRTAPISEFKVTVYNLYVAWLHRPRKCIRGLENWFHWVYLLTLSYFNFK